MVASGNELGTYAVYPYNASHKFNSEKTMTYSLPKEYTNYTPKSKIFGSTGDYRSNSTNMPMLGKITSGDDDSKSISFKCLGGLAVIRIDKMPATEGTLTVSADQQLSGNFSVDLSADEAKIATTTASGDNGKVTFTFNGASAENASVFYLPLATGDYTNVKVTIGETTEVDCGRVSIARAGVTAISIVTYSGTLPDYSNKLLRSYGSNKYYVGSDKYLINDHEFVDLGLNVLWATMNVGAGSETAAGNCCDFSSATSTTQSSWGTAVSPRKQGGGI